MGEESLVCRHQSIAKSSRGKKSESIIEKKGGCLGGEKGGERKKKRKPNVDEL